VGDRLIGNHDGQAGLGTNFWQRDKIPA